VTESGSLKQARHKCKQSPEKLANIKKQVKWLNLLVAANSRRFTHQRYSFSQPIEAILNPFGFLTVPVARLLLEAMIGTNPFSWVPAPSFWLRAALGISH